MCDYYRLTKILGAWYKGSSINDIDIVECAWGGGKQWKVGVNVEEGG